ncbi:MAG: polyphosphate polymerase domain-containing protein [Cryomorphaceae bacterium]|nr:polyphosphate polymerase domain-containing protein [Cryomorphaceae bacterium]
MSTKLGMAFSPFKIISNRRLEKKTKVQREKDASIKKIRYERKYLVPIRHLTDLRKRFAPFVENDKYGIPRKEGVREYTVRSIYLDSLDWNAYDEKIEGLRDRNKLRIRGYNEYHPDNSVFFEIKHKYENRIGKSRGLIPFNEINNLLENGAIERFHPPNDPKGMHNDLRRFLYYYHRFHQRPVTTIVYEREAFFGKIDPGVRITFDKNIRSNIFPNFEELYYEGNCKLCWPGFFILEIKYFTDQMPRWARSIVQEFSLQHEALSKYAQGIDVNYTNNPMFNRA